MENRKQAILRAVVNEFTTSAVPVGSQSLHSRYFVNLSSASSLRMVAEDRLTKYRLWSDWEPTGTALVVNSFTTARRIACFLFSIVIGTLASRVLTTVPRARSGCAGPFRDGLESPCRRSFESGRRTPAVRARYRIPRAGPGPRPCAGRA